MEKLPENGCLPAVIELLESDAEEDDDEIPLPERQSEAVRLFRSVLPQVTVSQARQHLSRIEWDVDRAIDQYCSSQQTKKLSQQKLYPKNPEAQKDEESKSEVLSCARNDENTQITTGRQPEQLGDRKSTTPTVSTISQHESLCEAWHQIVAEYNSTGTVFIDNDFPPNHSSIDGRQRSDTTATPIVQCHCGFIATPKRVQSDGPNFGRFYLVCGRADEKKRTKVTTTKDSNTSSGPAALAIHNPYAKKQPPPPQQQLQKRDAKCNFFQWDTTGSKGIAATGYSNTQHRNITWHNFGLEPRCAIVRSSFHPSHVRQGAVGNCWFLSALAVVAEQEHLMQKIVGVGSLLPHPAGCYQVNLFLDGCWQPVLVDAHLPVVVSTKAKEAQHRGAIQVQQSGRLIVPAFCAAPDYQIWAPLVEKAYAKAHGSYQMLSGGFIQEGLQDLTGAPTETVVFQHVHFDREVFWARLLSFASAGFLMGVATAGGGDGLVGSHAYSVLDIMDLQECVIGAQPTLTELWGPEKRRKVERTCVRLVRIRNPWGQKEWKGSWSATSEKWTTALRTRLQHHKTFAKGDGTFFMSYDDMLQRFHHMDVAMTRKVRCCVEYVVVVIVHCANE